MPAKAGIRPRYLPPWVALAEGVVDVNYISNIYVDYRKKLAYESRIPLDEGRPPETILTAERDVASTAGS
jgi:hypothetical protein